jgi:hypothetical protein
MSQHVLLHDCEHDLPKGLNEQGMRLLTYTMYDIHIYSRPSRALVWSV